MTSRPILQSSDSSFEDQNTVPPWRALIDYICQDLEDSVFRKLLFLSKDLLGTDVYQKLSSTDSSEVCYHQYFIALEDDLGENGAVNHLEHLMNHTNLHSDTGENYGEEIRKYREAKKLYLQRCTDKGIALDPNFVGRELLLEDVLKYLRKDFKGVVLCGISGIGKTCFANQVCYRLMYSKPRWNIIVVNQREKSTLNELLVDIITELSAELCVADNILVTCDMDMRDLKIQCHTLLTELVDKQMIGNNKRMKCEMMPSQAGTLRNRGEVYYMQELLEKALTDGKNVLKIVKNLYVSPHIEVTLAVERVAHYHLKIGKKKQKDMDSEGQGHLEESMKYYNEALRHIKIGGLPIEYNDARTYRLVRENHMKVMKLLGYEQRLKNDRIRQYQAFEEGKYNKNIEHNRQQDLDFVSTNSSSTSSSPNPGSPRAQVMMEVEQVLALHRKDSGVEEDEMSDAEMKDGGSFDIAGEDNGDLSRSYGAGAELTNMDIDATLEQRDTARDGTNSDNVFVKKVVRKKSSSCITRQASIDLPDVAEENESLYEAKFTKPRALVRKSDTTSQSSIEEDLFVEMRTKKRPGPVASTSSSTGDSGRESWTSSTSSSSFECQRKFSTDEARESWRGGRLSESLGSQKRQDTWSSAGSEDDLFTGAQKKRNTWSSAGSHDSVTSQMGRMLNLEDLEEDKDDDNVEPARKMKKI